MANTQESGGGGGCGCCKNNAAEKLSDAGNSKVKLLCSYGGKIQPRPRDHQLMYVGGDAKLLTVDRNIKFSDVVAKLNSVYNFNSDEVCIKYQLPGEDLDVLVSLTNDDDLENMMFEYDRLQDKVSPSSKPERFRLFLSGANNNPAKPSTDIGSEAPLNPDYLFGFDKEYDYSSNTNNRNSAHDLSLWTIPSTVPGESGLIKNGDGNRKSIDVQEKNAGPVHSQVTGGGECTAAAAAAATVPAQLIYHVPVVSSGFHAGGKYRMVPLPVGVVNGFPERPVYNVVPSSVAVVSEQKKIPVTTVDSVYQKRNV